MARRKTEPVGHTCPDIDSTISTITAIVREMNSFNEDSDKGELLSSISNWASDLASIGIGSRCMLEDLRNSNSALREWGHDMYNKAENLESERDEIESKYNDLLNK